MQRTTQNAFLQLSLLPSQPGLVPLMMVQNVSLKDDSGNILASQQTTLPMVASDFTPDLLASINTQLALVGLKMVEATS